MTENLSNINSKLAIVHADIYHCHKHIFLTMIDKFTKHLFTQKLNDRNAITIIELFRNRFSVFGKPKKMVLDNEFNNINVKEFFRNENILCHFTSPRSHTGNSDIERVHGTLNEHLRILESEKSKLNSIEKVLLATEKYNNTIHSTTNHKPVDFINNKITDLQTIKQKILDRKTKIINKLNENKKDIKFDNNDEILVNNPESDRHKHKPKYIKIKVKPQDNRLLDIRDRHIHISRTKRKFKFSPTDKRQQINENEQIQDLQ